MNALGGVYAGTGNDAMCFLGVRGNLAVILGARGWQDILGISCCSSPSDGGLGWRKVDRFGVCFTQLADSTC